MNVDVVLLTGVVGNGAVGSSDADDAVRMLRLDADVGGDAGGGRLKLARRATVVPTPFTWLSVRRIDPPILLPPSVLRRCNGSYTLSGLVAMMASATAGTGSPFVVNRAAARWSIRPGA